MRIFGSDKIKNMMRTLKIPEDQPIENKMITRAIGSAQAKIEGMNFDIRKHLLEYDNVLNKQRGKIYGLRRKALFANKDELGEIITGFFDHAGEDISKLSEKEREFGKEDFANAERNLLLRVIDMLWTDHLEAMDYMRSSVNLRAYGQRDPLIEYKNEGARMFKQMEDSMGDTFVKLILNVQKTQGMKNEESTFRNSKLEIRNSRPKVGRNAPCPCGSGKKYKKCCGK